MTAEPSPKQLRSLPVQLIEFDGGVVLKRGCTEVRIGGDGVAHAVQLLLTATSNHGATRQEICQLFAPAEHSAIEHLIDELVARRLLVYCSAGEPLEEGLESSLDVFYWHFDARAPEVNERLNCQKIVILGVNSISQQLALSLSKSGVKNLRIVDHPALRNPCFFDHTGRLKEGTWPIAVRAPGEYGEGIAPESVDCLVVTSDFGRNPTLREWNGFCVEHRRHFLPVILHNVIGYVGPLVVPGETACFECLLARQNSHLENPEIHRVIEEATAEGQRVIGFHPSMPSTLAEVAAFELTKFYSGLLPGRVGTLIEVNLLATRMMGRKVLKVPRCPTCSPLNTRPSTTPRRSMFTLVPEAKE